jgi:hypothetical protein
LDSQPDFISIQKEKGVFQHSSFLAGGATIAAGRLTAENGVIKVLPDSNISIRFRYFFKKIEIHPYVVP